MPWTERHTVTVVTDAQGNGVGYTPAGRGYLYAVKYTKGDYVDGVSVKVETDITGAVAWQQANVNASVLVRPRPVVHNVDGTVASQGASETLGGFVIADERVRITVTAGGASKSGTFDVIVTV